MKDYNIAIEINPKHAEAYIGRGHIYFVLKNFQQAINNYNQGIELEPSKFAEAYLYRGMSYEETGGKCGLAITNYEKAIELNPKSSDAFNAIAWVLATCKSNKYRDGKKAVQYGEKALALLEKNSDDNSKAHVYDTLAAAYAETGIFDKAVMMESKAYNLYKPQNAKDEDKEDFKQLIDVYKKRQTYVQWKSRNN